MQNKTPVALIVFSNDLDNYLSNIETERKLIEEALEHYDDTNRLKVITRSSVSLEELFRLFNRYSGRIVLFHFSGHADGQGLQFNRQITQTETGKAAGMAALLGREAKAKLKFVFLNGCSTAAQVQQLKALGIPNIIATHYPISDFKAVRFSNRFYRSWAKSDALTTAFEAPFMTLRQAFDDALAYLEMRYTVRQTTARGFTFEIEEMEEDEPWELFATQPEQTLLYPIGQDSKTFNEHITWHLIQALKTHESIQTFLQDHQADWDINIQSQNEGKRRIEAQFPWVISWELRRLFAIPKERDKTLPQKIEEYIEHCLRTYRLTLQLVNYTLISHLWDKKKNVANNEVLQAFFNNRQVLTTAKHFTLFQELRKLYNQQSIDFPFAALADDKFLPKQELFNRACNKLQILEETIFNKNLQELKHCFHAEKQLTTILETLIFIADYQLVSMRKVEYQRLRHQ